MTPDEAIQKANALIAMLIELAETTPNADVLSIYADKWSAPTIHTSDDVPAWVLAAEGKRVSPKYVEHRAVRNLVSVFAHVYSPEEV